LEPIFISNVSNVKDLRGSKDETALYQKCKNNRLKILSFELIISKKLGSGVKLNSQ
jgi:hypothetical protein